MTESTTGDQTPDTADQHALNPVRQHKSFVPHECFALPDGYRTYRCLRCADGWATVKPFGQGDHADYR